jgi:hypothetical protein
MMNSLAGIFTFLKSLGDFGALPNVFKSVRFLELPEKRTPRKGDSLALAVIGSLGPGQLQSVPESEVCNLLKETKEVVLFKIKEVL